MKISCPKCRWEPRAGSRWECAPGCGTSWNTFDTAGRCPGCSRVFRETQCLRCLRFSPHHDWYNDLPPVDVDAILTSEPREVPG